MSTSKSKYGSTSRKSRSTLYVNKTLAYLIGRRLGRKETVQDVVNVIDSQIDCCSPITDLLVMRFDGVRKKPLRNPETFSGPIESSWHAACKQSQFMRDGGSFDILISSWLHEELRSEYKWSLSDHYWGYSFNDPKIRCMYCITYKVCGNVFYIEINCKGTYPFFRMSGDALKVSGSRKMPTMSYESYETDREIEL